MNRNFFKTFAALLLIAGITHNGHVMGQRELDIDEIQVIAPYEPSISEAFKINLDPVIEDTVTVDMDFDYRIEPRRAFVRFDPEPITPARMRGEPLERLYRGLIKGGYGSYQTPYFEGFYNTLRSDEYALGVHLKHRSSGQDIDNFPNSTFSRNKANVYGTRFYDAHKLTADIDYNRHVFHYYGRQPMSLGLKDADSPYQHPSASTTRQRYESLASAVSFGNNAGNDARVHYKSGLQHQWLSDRFDGSEHLFRLHGEIGSQVAADPFEMMDEQRFSMEADARYYYLNNQADTLHAGIYSLQSKLYSSIDRIDFHLGARVSVEDNQGNFTMRAYPLAGFQMDIIPENLIAGAAFSGGLKRHSWHELSANNPFVTPLAVTAFSNIRTEFNASIHGAIGNHFSYNLRMKNSHIDNYPFFARVSYRYWENLPINFPMGYHDAGFPPPQQPFSVLYDDIRKLQLTAEMFYRFGENLSMRLRGDYYEYTLDRLPGAFHKPGFEVNLHARYNIQDKIILTADLFGRDKTRGGLLEPGPGWQTLIQEYDLHDFYADVNLGIEYRYNKRLSAFLNFSNILNEDYERWLGYPTQGFNFLGGLGFAF